MKKLFVNMNEKENIAVWLTIKNNAPVKLAGD